MLWIYLDFQLIGWNFYMFERETKQLMMTVYNLIVKDFKNLVGLVKLDLE